MKTPRPEDQSHDSAGVDPVRRMFLAAFSAGAAMSALGGGKKAYAQEEEARGGARMRRLLIKPVHNLFAGEPMGKRFRATLDQALMEPSLDVRQVLERATAVMPAALLEVLPGSAAIPAPEAVRH